MLPGAHTADQAFYRMRECTRMRNVSFNKYQAYFFKSVVKKKIGLGTRLTADHAV